MSLDFRGQRKKHEEKPYAIVQLDFDKPTKKLYADFDYNSFKKQLVCILHAKCSLERQ